jgi:hypothetical protein
MVPSETITATISTYNFQRVGAYSGTLSITNNQTGYLTRENIVIEQSSAASNGVDTKEYAKENDYTLRFTPTNAIPRIGWVLIKYPDDVSIASRAEFISSCKIETSGNYQG